MREIKFRCWDKKSKKMRQVTEIVFNTGFYLEPNDNSVKLIWVKGQNIIENKEIQIQRQRQDDFELMQYTGLKDKNGVEIYEGDIVYDSFYERKAQVVFLEGAFWLDYIKDFKEYETIHKRYQLLANYDNKNVFEVIGNIYNNPELLEKGE